jgi:hypothetical protein
MNTASQAHAFRDWRPDGIIALLGRGNGIVVWLRRALAWAVVGLCVQPFAAWSADVVGYSILKGEFLIQTGADELVLDPDFGFSLLASVDLADFDLLKEASLRLPDGNEREMDDVGDYWAFLDSAETLASLDEVYTWGDYVVLFSALHDGDFSCLISLPEAPLPPTPHLLNFVEVHAVNPGAPLKLTWDFDAPPESDDFVQVYVNLGHAEVFSTPDLAQPGALDGTSRSVSIPAGTLQEGRVYSLNLEITRLVSTNSECYPYAEGLGCTFRSVAVDVTTVVPPVLRVLSQPTNGVMLIEVRSEPEQMVVLQASVDLEVWSNMSTNADRSGTNRFSISVDELYHRFFRAWQQPAVPMGMQAAGSRDVRPVRAEISSAIGLDRRRALVLRRWYRSRN